jgi:hypothetical protein
MDHSVVTSSFPFSQLRTGAQLPGESPKVPEIRPGQPKTVLMFFEGRRSAHWRFYLLSMAQGSLQCSNSCPLPLRRTDLRATLIDANLAQRGQKLTRALIP